MNLIQGNNVYEDVKINNKNTGETELQYMHQWRDVDYKKIDQFLEEMFKNIKMIDPEYKYEIVKKPEVSVYLCDYVSFYDTFHVRQTYKEHEREFFFKVPKLLYGNYFLLNNALYTPLIFLEKGPIDMVKNKDKFKIYANLWPMYNFTFDLFDLSKARVFFSKANHKGLPLDIFLKVIFENEKEKWNQFLEDGFIQDLEYSIEYKRKFAKFLGYNKDSYFDDKDMADWIDNYFFLDFYKEIFKTYYGFDNIKEIILEILKYYNDDVDIDMANIQNRRLVMIEYLIKPLFELYMRLLNSIVDKRSQNFLPTVNPEVMLTTGFNKLMHRGNLYDISIPYASPLINKISQDISIIDEGRLPKSWIRNDESAFGVVCPISVSAQKTAINLVLSTNTMADKYGKLYLKINKD